MFTANFLMSELSWPGNYKFQVVRGLYSAVKIRCAHAKRGRNTTHHSRHKMVKVAVRGSRELQGPEADVVQGFIVDTEGLVRVLYELVHRQGGIVWLGHRI